MGHENNRDLRNTGDGGWFYAENELFSVFAPLIGIEGVGIYMAMCRLIPLAAVDPDRPVTVRAVMEASCARRTMTNCKMAEIVALGMVLEEKAPTRNRPSTYTLVSLRKLAQLGSEELKRRIGVRPTDTESSEPQQDPISAARVDLPRVPSSSAQQQIPTLAEMKRAEHLPEASSRFGVRPTDTEEDLPAATEFCESVSATEASVSATEASVSAQSGHPLTKKKKIEEEEYPPTPLPGVSKNSEADAEEDRRRWGGLAVELKSALYSTSVGLLLAKHFRAVKPGENDFDACFRVCWLDEVRRVPIGIEIYLGTDDRKTTTLGIEKYRARLIALVRKHFELGPSADVRVRLAMAETAGEASR